MKINLGQSSTHAEGIVSPPMSPLSDVERITIITNVIESLRTNFQADGGDITLVAVEGDKVRVRLSGACAGCGSAGLTLGGIRRQLIHELGEPVLVVPATLG
jgi:Fe-S cluster biogenesis protein NfuA